MSLIFKGLISIDHNCTVCVEKKFFWIITFYKKHKWFAYGYEIYALGMTLI